MWPMYAVRELAPVWLEQKQQHSSHFGSSLGSRLEPGRAAPRSKGRPMKRPAAALAPEAELGTGGDSAVGFRVGATAMSGETPAGPTTIVVTVEIAPDRIDDFKRAITIDAEGSRTEPGCLRFDVMQCQDPAGRLISNKYQFFEVYKDEASIAFHREQAHFKAWGDFKVSGGVVADSQTSAVDWRM